MIKMISKSPEPETIGAEFKVSNLTINPTEVIVGKTVGKCTVTPSIMGS